MQGEWVPAFAESAPRIGLTYSGGNDKEAGGTTEGRSVLAGAHVRSVDKGSERWYKMNVKEHGSARLNSDNRGAEITPGLSAENMRKLGEERL